MSILIKNGRLLNNGEWVNGDLYISEGIIKEMGTDLSHLHAEKTIDAHNLVVAPGFIDLHVHLREPGGEQKETIETGTLSAAKGGFTTVAAMPNTRPVPDNKEQLQWVQNRIQETAHVKVLPYASITVREAGQELTNFAELKEAGAFALTDDGVGVQSAGMMLEAMKRAADVGLSIVAHCEDNSLINKGSVHEGSFSEKHGINGIPSVCESVQIARDVLLAETANCHYHVCHISTKESVRAVRDAKQAGIHVTAEVTPHHLLLCDEDIPGLDTNYKMNPPLRSSSDRDALIQGILDGTIDFIATDHAPHTKEEKAEGMDLAPFGIVGLETAFPLLYTNLVEKGIITVEQLIELLAVKPAKTFGLKTGKIEIGCAADVVLLDLNQEMEINPDTFLSKGKNTPFTGWKCKGWPVATIVDGKIAWEKGRE